MSQGIGLSLLLNRPYDRNPYDEPEEVFDAWVSNLESTINAALHPPRKPLFPNPEPEYTLTPEKRARGEGDVFGGAVRPTLQTRTTTEYSENGMDEEEEEEGWPLPAALRSGGRRSGEGLGGMEESEESEEEEDDEEEEEEESDEQEQDVQPTPLRTGSSLAQAQVISDSDDDDQLQGSPPQEEDLLMMEEDEEVEPEGDYDEEDEEYDQESDEAQAQQLRPQPPAQHRNGAQQNFPGFSIARNLDAAQQFVSAAAGPSRRVEEQRQPSDAPEVIELSDSDEDEEKPVSTQQQQQHQPNGFTDEQEEEEEEEDSWDEEEEENEDEVEQQPTSRRDPFAPQSQRFPPRPSQQQPIASSSTINRPPTAVDMEEDEDQLDEGSYDESDELDAAESSGPNQEEGEEDDDEITSFIPEVEEPTSLAVARTRTPSPPPPAVSTTPATQPRNPTLSPISSALQQNQHLHQSLVDDYPSGTPSEQDPSESSDYPLSVDDLLAQQPSQSQSQPQLVEESHTLQGLAAFLGQMESPQPQSQQQPSFAPQIDPSLLQGEGVDLDADQLGRPLFGEEAREVVERDGDLVGWEDEFLEKEEGVEGGDMEEFVEQESEMVEDEEMEVEDASVLPPATPAAIVIEEEEDDDEIIAIERPESVPAIAPPPLQARELDIKAQLLRKKLFDAKAAKSPSKPKAASPPPLPSSSTWKESPERPSYLPFDAQASSSSSHPPSLGPIASTLDASSTPKPDEFELEHEASIQPHRHPPSTTLVEPSAVSTPASVTDDFEMEHEAAIQPSSSLEAHHQEVDASHEGIGPSPFAVRDVQEAPIYHAHPLVPGPSTLVPTLEISPPATTLHASTSAPAIPTPTEVVDLVDSDSSEDEIEALPSKPQEVVLDDEEEEEDREIVIEDEGSQEEDEEEDEIEEMGSRKESAIEFDDEEEDEVEEAEARPSPPSASSSESDSDPSPSAAVLVELDLQQEIEVKITSMSPAPQSSSLDASGEITEPEGSPQPLISFDNVQVEEMEDEIMGESLNVGGEEQVLDELADSASSSALMGVLSDVNVRAALASINDQSERRGREEQRVLGDPVEEVEVDELEEEEEGGETVPTGAADFIGFNESEDEDEDEDEESKSNQDDEETEPEIFYAGPSSPLYFPSSDDDDSLPLPSPLEEFNDRRSETPTPESLEPASSSLPPVAERIVEPSPSRILPGVIKAGLWDKNEFPPFFSSPGAGPSKTQKEKEEENAVDEPSSDINTDVFTADDEPSAPSPAPSTQDNANFPDPRAAPPPTNLVTPDVPITIHVEPSMVVEGGETRQVTPVPSEQMDYDDVVDDSDRHPVDLEEAIERNQRIIEEEEEFASDSIPLETEPSVVPSYVEPRTPPRDEPGTPIEPRSPSRASPEHSVVPAYVEPETPPRDEPSSGPPSPGFAPVASFNDLPDPALPPAPTTFLVPDVPRHLSPPEQSLVCEAPQSRAVTPPPPSATEEEIVDEEEEDKENIPPTDEELAAAVLAREDDAPELGAEGGGSSRSRSESGSSQGSVDYGLDASNSGDSDDDVVGIVEVKSDDGEVEEEIVEADDDGEGLLVAEEQEDEDEEEKEQHAPVARPSFLGSRNDSENDLVPTSDPAEEDPLPLDIAPYRPSESSPPRPNPFARTVVPDVAPPSFPFPSQPEASTSFHRPSALVFDEPEAMSPVVDRELESVPMAPSRPSVSSSRSLSYHVHGSRSRPGSSYSNLPPNASSSSRPMLPPSSSSSRLALPPPPDLSSPSSDVPLIPPPSRTPQPPAPQTSPVRSSPSSSRTVSLSKQQPDPPTSPITRSQCVYHLLRIPGPTRYAESVIFVVPFCSLALVDAIEEENARIMGKASDEENEARQEIVGEGRVVLEEEMEQKLTRICGIDIVRAGECFYLRSVPREEEDGSAPEESDEQDDEEKEDEQSSPTKPSSAPPKPSRFHNSSTGGSKRKRRGRFSGGGGGGAAESDDEEKVASPAAKRRSPRKSSPAKEKEEEEGEVAESSSQAVKRKRSDGGGGEEEKEVKTPKKKKGLFAKFFG